MPSGPNADDLDGHLLHVLTYQHPTVRDGHDLSSVIWAMVMFAIRWVQVPWVFEVLWNVVATTVECGTQVKADDVTEQHLAITISCIPNLGVPWHIREAPIPDVFEVLRNV